MKNKEILKLKIQLLELKIELLEYPILKKNKTQNLNILNPKENKIYSVEETAIELNISKRAVQKRCRKYFIKKLKNKYLITEKVILKWKNERYNGEKFNLINNYIETKTYLMKDKHNGLYKIGKSRNPKIRERTLQSEKPSIIMVKTWNYDIEKKLHNLYNKFRVRGEYFKLTQIQVKYICTHF